MLENVSAAKFSVLSVTNRLNGAGRPGAAPRAAQGTGSARSTIPVPNRPGSVPPMQQSKLQAPDNGCASDGNRLMHNARVSLSFRPD